MNGNAKKYICLDIVQLASPLRFSHMAKTLTNQFELSGTFNTGNIKHNYLGGYTFTFMNRNSYTGYSQAPVNDPLNSSYDVYGPGLYSKVSVRDPHSMGYIATKFSKAIVTKDYSHGIYFQDLIELNEQLKVLLAGRYDIYTYKRGNSKDDKGNLVNFIPTYDGKRKYHDSNLVSYNTANNTAFTYRAGLVYLPIPSVSIYGSAASYFKPDRSFPAANTIYLNKDGNEINTESDKGMFDAEQGYQFEGGARYSYNNILEASFSAYYIRKNDVVRSFPRRELPDGSIKTVVMQLASEQSTGFDIELKLRPTNYSRLNMGYAYTDMRVSDLKENRYVDKDSQVITLVPHNTFYTYGNVTVPKGLFKNISFLLSVSFMDKTNRNAAKTLSYPSYCLTDVGASYPLKNGITLSANVNNVFDKKYYNQALGYQIVPGMPRNYLLSLSYSLR